jgi:hypothetical protein
VLDAPRLRDAQLCAENAMYDFSTDLVAAEQQIAFDPFLEPAADVEKMLNDIQHHMGGKP